MRIPKIAHRIWFGDGFTPKYQKYMRLLATLNPDYTVKLWSDPGTMSETAYRFLQMFCKENHIELRNIREHPELINYDLIMEELDTAPQRFSYRRLHYVRASDIARISILFEQGGIYTDADTKMTKPFQEFQAKYGVLLKLFGVSSENLCYNFFEILFPPKVYHYFFTNIFYDFIACTPHHQLLEMTVAIIQRDYQTYHTSLHREWENCTDSNVLLYGTIKLTGTALKWALNYGHQSGKLSFNDPNELFFDANILSQSDYDKSWLEGFEHSDEIAENATLNQFLNEMEQTRHAYYPIINYGEHPDLRESSSNPLLPISSILSTPSNQETIHAILQRRSQSVTTKEIPLPLLVHEPHWTFTPPTLPDIHFDYSQLSSTQENVTRKKIAEPKNGSGLLARLSLFYRHPHKAPEEPIKELPLQTSASDNPNPHSASQKTLDALKKIFRN